MVGLKDPGDARRLQEMLGHPKIRLGNPAQFSDNRSPTDESGGNFAACSPGV